MLLEVCYSYRNKTWDSIALRSVKPDDHDDLGLNTNFGEMLRA